MNPDNKPSLIGAVAGVIVGVVVFIGVNITSGWAIIPTRESVVDRRWGLSEPQWPDAGTTAVAAGGVYQSVCQTCHQVDGQGVTGAFPPLAGSEWVVNDPETPIRIVLLGLTGPIEVKGAQYNSLMPPPPGMTDEKVVEAVNHIRTNFGNNASEVDLALVQKVKASLGGRTEPLTAEELVALRGSTSTEESGGAAGQPASAAGAGGEEMAPPAAEGEPAAPGDQPGAEGQAAEAAPAEAAPGQPADQAPPQQAPSGQAGGDEGSGEEQ